MDEDVASDALDSVLEGFYEASLTLGHVFDGQHMTASLLIYRSLNAGSTYIVKWESGLCVPTPSVRMQALEARELPAMFGALIVKLTVSGSSGMVTDMQ